jgi:hypothetical protein
MKVILVIILVILAIRVLRKNIYFSAYTNLNRKMKDDMNRYREEERKREGQIIIDSSKVSRKNKNDDDGEYVDYTEIK